MDRTTENTPFYPLQFKDFVPRQLAAPGLFSKAEYESLQHSLEDLNDWMRNNSDYVIINIETVVLPNIHSYTEEGSEDPEIAIRTGDGRKERWHQFFRVWYK